MLQLYTSRYQDYSDLLGAPVRITAGAPRWKLGYKPYVLKEIAPDRAWLNVDRVEFTAKYRQKLNMLGAAAVVDLVKQIATKAGDDRLVLLCFEDLTKPGLWCHRTLFAQWWTERTGQTVHEITNTRAVPQTQPKLF